MKRIAGYGILLCLLLAPLAGAAAYQEALYGWSGLWPVLAGFGGAVVIIALIALAVEWID